MASAGLRSSVSSLFLGRASKEQGAYTTSSRSLQPQGQKRGMAGLVKKNYYVEVRYAPSIRVYYSNCLVTVQGCLILILPAGL
jgi:hypothetical protein